jgi:hypothetical protein
MAVGLVAGCGASEQEPGDSELPRVQSYRGDPANYTASGFPRHRYEIQDCGFVLPLRPPFEVSEDGFGSPDIRVPLDLLDDPSVRTVAEGGSDARRRLSFAFPSRYRGQGMREWFRQFVRTGTAGEPRPLESLVSNLGSADARRGAAGIGGESRYLGTLGNGRQVAVYCTATDWPNPTCRAEIDIGPAGSRYLAIFPPRAADRFERIVAIGDDLFAGAAAACGRQ